MSESEFDFSLPVRIFYEDTDAGGVVYYANYLKFMERARTEMVRSVVGPQALLEQGVVLVVRDAQVKYRLPARLDDLINVTVSVVRVGRASLVLKQFACLDGQILCSACFTIACVSCSSMKPTALPDVCKQYLDRLAASEG